MPNGDGTGPRWSNGNWNCRGRGFMPRCWAGRWQNRASITKEEEKEIISSRIEVLKNELEQLSKRAADLSS